MLNQINDVNVQELLRYIFAGIIVCCIAVFIIKVVADYIWQTGKILYKRYIIPMFIIAIPILFYNETVSYVGINIPFKVFQITSVVIMLIILLNLVIKAGIVKGLCLFIIQVVGAILCASAIYAGIVIMAGVFALIVGGTWLIEEHFICMIALDDGEIIYVRNIQDYYIDQEGRSYFRNGKYVYRMDDNKLFAFYK